MSFGIPEEYGYLDTHEWIRLNGDVGTVGITDFAQDELGDVIFVELPDEGEVFAAEEQLGMIESIKAMSDLYLPMAGTVVDVNERLIDEPELVNEEPYGDGWVLEIEVESPSDQDHLLDADEYRENIR